MKQEVNRKKNIYFQINISFVIKNKENLVKNCKTSNQKENIIYISEIQNLIKKSLNSVKDKNIFISANKEDTKIVKYYEKDLNLISNILLGFAISV